METLSDAINTYHSYSLPSPTFCLQKKIYKSQCDYSFLRNGHKGDKDLEEDLQNQSSYLDKSQNGLKKTNQNGQNVHFKAENMQLVLKNIKDLKKKKQDSEEQKDQTNSQQSPLPIIESAKQQEELPPSIAKKQRSILRFWKKENDSKNQPNLNLEILSPLKLNTSNTKGFGIDPLRRNSPSRKSLQTNSDIAQTMTQEELKIRSIFLKKFEVKRDLNIKKFMRILVSRFQNRKLNLNQKQLNLINDKAYFYQTSTENQNNCIIRQFSRLCSSFKNACQFIPLLNPTNQWKLLWDFFMITVLGIFLYVYSALLFFAQTEKYVENAYAKFAFISFCIDILLKFNTSYYSKDSIIRNRLAIAEQYFKSTLVYDFISAFVLGLNMSQDNLVLNYDNNILIYVINSLVLLKIVSFQDKIKHLEQSVPMKEKWRHILSLVGLLASIVIVAHCVAILWNAIGQYETSIGIEHNWQSKLGIQDSTWEVRYIYSLYWSITTMCTVGYGDITPLNSWEVAFVTVNIIFVSTVFAYNINSIGIILSDIAKISKQYKEDLSIMNRFLNRKQVNIDLQFRVKKYLEFLADEEKEVNKKAEDTVIDKLSSHLKEQITIEVNTKILRKYPLFSKNFSEKTLQKLVFIMKEVVVTPNELIIQEGAQDDCSLYLITKGEVEIYSLCDPLYQNQTQNKKVFTNLGMDQYFGELSFFTGQKRTANVRSLSLTSMYKISQESFINVLRSSNEQDFEKFCMLRDEIIHGSLTNIQVQCYSCNEQGHTTLEVSFYSYSFSRFYYYSVKQIKAYFIILTNNKLFYLVKQKCPQITYDADRIIRLFRMNYSELQEEKQYTRLKRKKINSLFLLQSGALQNVRQGLLTECEEYLKQISKINQELKQNVKFQLYYLQLFSQFMKPNYIKFCLIKQQGGQRFQSIVEMELDLDSKEDSSNSSDKNSSFNDKSDSIDNQIVSLGEGEEDDVSKDRFLEDEAIKKDKFIIQNEQTDKNISRYSSFTNSSSRLSQEILKVKPQIEFKRKSSRFQNINHKNSEDRSSLKTNCRSQYFYSIYSFYNTILIQFNKFLKKQLELNQNEFQININPELIEQNEKIIMVGQNARELSDIEIKLNKQKSDESDFRKAFRKTSTINTAPIQQKRESFVSLAINSFPSNKDQQLHGQNSYLDQQFVYDNDQKAVSIQYHKDQDNFDSPFEKMKIFKSYFPKYNYPQVLKDIIDEKKKCAKLLKYRCKQFYSNRRNGNASMKRDQQIFGQFRKSNKRIQLQQIVKSRITDRIHPIIYGAGGINKYPSYK